MRLFSSNRIDPITTHRLAVRMDTFKLDGKTLTFWYPLVVKSTYSFKALLLAMCSKYPWETYDIAEVFYWDNVEEEFLPLRTDPEVELMFIQNISARFGKIILKVVQKHRVFPKEK